METVQVKLAAFDGTDFNKGAGFLKTTLWYFVNALIVRASWNPFMGIKIVLLRAFGAKIGKGLVIKNNVIIKSPWNLVVGDDCWLGESCWIDNLDKVVIGNNVCISQGALLLTGNHDYTISSMPYRNAPIKIEDGAWIGAKTTVCPDVTVHRNAILTVGSVATKDMEENGIYQGNPAVKIRERKKKKLMKVSIITSCYNREKTIRGAVESVLAQDYPDIEYIIVDGASKDQSAQIIREAIAGHEDKVKFISEPDHGMYEAINKGIRMATGDVIALCHSDDFMFAKDTVSHVVKKMEETDCDFLYADGIFVNEQNTNKVVRKWIGGKYARWKVRCGWLPLHPTCYIKREVMMKCGLYDESYKIAADTNLLVNYLYNCHLKVAYLPEFVTRMRMGGMSTDSAKRKKMWDEDIRVYSGYGFMPVTLTKLMKMAWKVPQFIKAKFM